MKYSLFFGETERRILAAETPKEVMQIAWQAGVLLPKKAVLELFREVKKYRRQAELERLDENAMETVTGGTNALQAIFCLDCGPCFISFPCPAWFLFLPDSSRSCQMPCRICWPSFSCWESFQAYPPAMKQTWKKIPGCPCWPDRRNADENHALQNPGDRFGVDLFPAYPAFVDRPFPLVSCRSFRSAFSGAGVTWPVCSFSVTRRNQL